MRDPFWAILLRLLVVAIVAGLIAGARPLLKAWRARRAQRALVGAPLAQWRTGQPLVLLFTGALCSDCIRQKDILARLDSSANRIGIQEIFAARAPELAQRFGVRSVPATVVLDGEGRARAVNYGLVDAATLRRQLVG